MTDLRDSVASIKEHRAGKITLRTSTVPKVWRIPYMVMASPPALVSAAIIRRQTLVGL